MRKIIVYITLCLFIISTLIPLGLLFLSSISLNWQWPELFPSQVTIRFWTYTIKDGGSPIITSLAIAFITGFINILLALPTADALGRHSFRGKRFVEAFLMLPVIVPPIVVMLGIHKTFILSGLADKTSGVIIAHMVPTLPYMIRTLAASYERLGFKWEDQAQMLGARWIDRIRYVTIPFLLPGMTAGFILTVLISMSQYAITLLIGGGQVITIPIKMYPYLKGGDISIGSVYSVLFALTAIFMMSISNYIVDLLYRER